jgi:hypothetical protein
MRQRLIDARNDYFTALARNIYRDPDTVSGEDIKAKAAYFRGAFWVLNQPVFERKAIERAIAQTEGAEEV